MIAVPAVANAQVSAGNRYAALGDSVAAGWGLGATDGSDESQLCGRSNNAYPGQVASAKNLQLENYSCTGAKSRRLGSRAAN
jgi:hypothetical protein